MSIKGMWPSLQLISGVQCVALSMRADNLFVLLCAGFVGGFLLAGFAARVVKS